MTATQLTPAAKEVLRKTIRGLRETLITQLKEEAERVYRLGVPLEKAKLSEERAKRRERLETWADEQSRADWAPASSGKAATGKAATKAKGEKKGEPTQPGNKSAGTKAPSTTKPPSDKVLQALRERYLLQAVKEAAHTFINRLVILRILEEGGLSKPAVLTGGYKSKGYAEFKEYAGALCETFGETGGGTQGDVDGTKGYAALLQLLFDELSVELPGVFGRVGLTSLFPIPAATLREVVEALNDPALESAWGDDTTLGWVYQFWNDPEREALDEKINGGGKIEPHEIAPKTQMFTERYMVEWLLQNSLGQTWLAMCKKHGWTPEFDQVRGALDERRAEWRKKREAGEVAPDELMPIYPAGPDGQLEEHWKYWVPQVMPEDAPAAAPDRLRDLKLLDPACGSGHFLVIAFDLLAALYQEEARHLAATGGAAAGGVSAVGAAAGEAGGNGELTDPAVIAAQIVEHNLHGVDIDTRAVQIAAAALWLKAKLWVKTQRERAPGANGTSGEHSGSEKKGALEKHGALDEPGASDRQGASQVNGASEQTGAAKPRAGDWLLSRINLVAPNFKLAGLAQDDPALLRLKQRLRVEVGIPESLTENLVGALGGVDHLGSLLRVDKNVRQALATYEVENFGINAPAAQTTLFAEVEPKKKIQLSLEDAQARVMKQLAKFLDAHEGESDLGLRLEGEQLAAGVRFLQMEQEGRFDIVVGNPPYQRTSKMAEAEWFKKHYPRSKGDLYACFLERGLELVKQGGVSALLTMRSWMFLSSYQAVREHLLQEYDLRSIGDFDRGAFDDVPNEVLAVSACALRKAAPTKLNSVAAQPTPSDDKSYDRERTGRKRAAVLAQVGRFEFDVAKLAGIEGTPLVYWWDNNFLDEYVKAPKLGEVAPGRFGMTTGDNGRFVRNWQELSSSACSTGERWKPFVLGAQGRVWFEPARDAVNWGPGGLAVSE